ncbi:hypothetical protein [Scytonema millei]|uniref:Transposase n=1 Tax=Scytonema millei VB511283 TaxID=1245923 RepID=A0A9X5I4X9_9CYAN|nr:hypothetical protein [Scytonema millei]NHC35386.1 hypothetical protein [Scytonema millei VB511283]
MVISEIFKKHSDQQVWYFLEPNQYVFMCKWTDRYLGRLRQVVGDRLLLVFGSRAIVFNF